jgi:phosphopantothenoylcysteine synthetase/decarboxylase
VCGAPLAARTADIAAAVVAGGWDTTVIGTPASSEWLDVETVTAATGRPVRFDYRKPSESKSGSEPDALVVCPATFNTVNKAVHGVADTYALGVIAEALGTQTLTVIVPMVNAKLWGHPVWFNNIDTLNEWGVVLLDVHTGERGAHSVASGSGPDVAGSFRPAWIVEALKTII